jgi:hypothetical protein
MCCRMIWVPPPPPTHNFVGIGSPLQRNRVCLPPLYPKSGGEKHSLAGEGVEGPNSDDWTESLALGILCGSPTLACRREGRAGGPKSYDRTETLVLYIRCSLYD